IASLLAIILWPSQQLKGVIRALQLEHKRFRSFAASLHTSKGGYLILQRVISLRILAGVGIASCTFHRLRLRNINVVHWGKLQRIFPIGNLIVVERETTF